MVKGNRLRKRILCILACILLIAATALPSSARTSIDLDKDFSVTIDYSNDEVPLSGVEFKMYHVAEISEYGIYSPTKLFKYYHIDFDYDDNAGWRILANTLVPYIERDGIEATTSGVTDDQGILEFASLKAGLYLVVGETKVVDGYKYIPENYLVSLPGLDEKDNWLYSVVSKPKSDREAGSDTEDTVCKVMKVWKDNDDKLGERPDYIEVELLRNGEVFETVKLSDENNWRYTWEKLDDKFIWSVTEKEVPDGYTVTINKENKVFVITNTSKESTKPTPKPSPKPGDPTPRPGEPTPNPSKPGLPQTGMLWWPVPILAILGITLVMVGWFMMRKKKNNLDK